MARLHRNLLRVLIADITSGTLPERVWLPREADLATEFSVSRGVAREALRGLEARGLVSIRQGRGAVVTRPRSWNVPDEDVMKALLAGPQGASLLVEFIEC